ncbi:MAG: hypothetical protein K2H41_12635 [Acetatifactor sp.]|nr:hypothetical protein [Acetatifactor sp.]
MIWLIVFVIFVISLCYFTTLQLIVLNPLSIVWNGLKDIYRYIRYKQWRILKTGTIICYVGLFGKGKTLSAVHDVVGKYRQYDNKKVYDVSRGKWVTQKVHIISNVELSVPYERFVSLAQIVTAGDMYHKKDLENDTLTAHLVLGDEFSVQLNSRSFKSNIDPLFLNTLLTCRHHHVSLICTAQRFGHIDALLRQVTQYVISCNKCWRFMYHSKYDAYDLENAANPLDVQPLLRFGWFIHDRDYNAYDTLACVDNLKKSCMEGDMLTEAEILALQQNTASDMGAVSRPSRRFLRRMRKIGGT